MKIIQYLLLFIDSFLDINQKDISCWLSPLSFLINKKNLNIKQLKHLKKLCKLANFSQIIIQMAFLLDKNKQKNQ